MSSYEKQGCIYWQMWGKKVNHTIVTSQLHTYFKPLTLILHKLTILTIVNVLAKTQNNQFQYSVKPPTINSEV